MNTIPLNIVGWKYAVDVYKDWENNNAFYWRTDKRVYSSEKDIPNSSDLKDIPGKRKNAYLYSVLVDVDQIIEIVLEPNLEGDNFINYLIYRIELYNGQRCWEQMKNVYTEKGEEGKIAELENMVRIAGPDASFHLYTGKQPDMTDEVKEFTRLAFKWLAYSNHQLSALN